MKTVSEIKALHDDSWIDGFTGEVVGIYPAKKVGRTTIQNCIVKDSTGTMYVAFAGKANYNQPLVQPGSRISLSGNGLKFRKDPKNADGKYDQITVLDAATVEFGSNGAAQAPVTAASRPTAAPVQSTESVKQLVERLIREWIQVRKWIVPILEEAELPVDRELVTSVIMGLKNRGITNIPIDGQVIEWRSIVINKMPLSEWPIEKLCDLIIMVMQGDTKLDKVKAALLQAKVDSDITNKGLLEHIVAKSAVSQAAYDNVLLGHGVAWDKVSEEQAGELVSMPGLAAELKEKYEQLTKAAEEIGSDVEISIE